MNNLENPPAFPTKHPALDPRTSGFHTESGMTLRDYFAAQAMSFCSIDDGGTVAMAAKELDIEASEYNASIHWPLLVAKSAYRYADAMLAERLK